MTTPTATQLKEKLNATIEKYMISSKERRTKAIQAIGQHLDVAPRQIYMWLKEESFPHYPQEVMDKLDSMPEKRNDVSIIPQTMFPFRIKIPKETMNVSRDQEGNIIVEGSLLIDLV